jgi:hypothetical protein
MFTIVKEKLFCIRIFFHQSLLSMTIGYSFNLDTIYGGLDHHLKSQLKSLEFVVKEGKSFM